MADGWLGDWIWKAAASAKLPYLAPVRADLTLVGVPVPAGIVAFDLVYQPASVRYGLWIAGATLLVLIVLGLWRAVRVWSRSQVGDPAPPPFLTGG